MADGLDKIKKQVAELLKSNKLTKESSDYYKTISASLEKSGASLGDWQRTLRSINDSLDKTSENLSYIATAFKESVQELQKGNVAINQQKASLNKLSNIARDLRDIRAGEKELTTDTLKKLQEKAQTEKSNLEIARNLLKIQGKSTAAIESQINDANLLLESYQDIEDVNNKINKEFGITSGLVKGLGVALKKAGFGDFSQSINDASMETSMMGQKAAQLGKPFSANATFAKSLFSNLSKSITPLKLFEVTLGLIVKSFMALDKMTGDLAKNLGISYKQSRNLNKEFTSLSQNSDNIFVTTKNLNESFGQLADRFSVTAGFSNETLQTQLELTKQAGYQAESASELAKLSILTGKSTKDIMSNALGTAVAFNGQNKLVLNEKKLLEEVANTSADIQLSMGNSTTELIKAAAQAKKFGMNLKQVDAIAGSLLDFESSIENELGDEKLADQLQANSIQERFNQSIQKAQEIFVNIASAISPFISSLATGIGYVATMVNKFQTLLKIVGGIYATNKLINGLSLISAGIQERKNLAKGLELGLGGQILAIMGLQNAAIEYKLAREQGSNVLSAIGVALEQTKLGAIIAQGFGVVKNIAKEGALLAIKVAQAAAALVGVSASTLGIGTVVALAAAAAGIAYLNSMTKADDLMSEGTGGSGYGGRVLLAGKDAFALNNSDTVLAGTNLGQGGGGGGTNMSTTNALLSQLIKKTPEMAPLGLYEVQ